MVAGSALLLCASDCRSRSAQKPQMPGDLVGRAAVRGPWSAFDRPDAHVDVQAASTCPTNSAAAATSRNQWDRLSCSVHSRTYISSGLYCQRRVEESRAASCGQLLEAAISWCLPRLGNESQPRFDIRWQVPDGRTDLDVGASFL